MPPCHGGGRGFESLLGRHYKIILVYGRIAQLGEHLPYKQGVTGSIPVAPTIYNAGVAQLVEQLTCNQQVAGSSPITSSIYLREWLSGRASPCQGERRGFESRLPLHIYYLLLVDEN